MPHLIERPFFLNEIKEIFDANPICALLGPRQCGKTTLAHQFALNVSPAPIFFDLELPSDLAMLENPELSLGPLEALVVIDEIQQRPDLFPYLRALVDAQPNRQFLILGSASRDLLQQSSESLAGRIGYIELTPLQYQECSDDWRRLWYRGGFPKAYLAKTEAACERWQKDFIHTFLERDLAKLGFKGSTQAMRRLWSMLAHFHGNILNYAELGRSLALSNTLIRQYIDLLEGAFMVRVLKPWFENMSKRQVKSPKIYLRDSGLLHRLLGISHPNLSLHPKVGASWEGFALEEIIRIMRTDAEDCYFWATAQQAELDLLIIKEGKRHGFEFKYTDHPKLTPSMRIAYQDLKLDSLTVIIPGNKAFALSEGICVKGLELW